MSSSIPAVYAALATVATAALPGVLIVEGQIGTFKASKQFILAEVEGADQPLTMGYPTQFEEAYAVTCQARFYQGGADANGARSGALAMFEAVRDQINTDRSLGLGDPMAASVSTYRVAAGFDISGTGVSGEVLFAVRISNVTT